ncbi:MAG: hypothetical protein QJR00_00830 [Bacillota bacterium]|nr:hypothetical protein [Bacillota bacterium]
MKVPRRIWAALLLALLLAGIWYGAVWRPSQPGYKGERPSLKPVEVDPSKRYTVVLWDVAHPVPDPSYEERLRAWAKRFTRDHPHIQIEVTLLDPQKAEDEVLKALSRGRPPDILAAPYDWGLMVSRWQVPLTRYMTPEGTPRFSGGATEAFSAAALRVAKDLDWPGFPRWLSFWWWAGIPKEGKEAFFLDPLPFAKQGLVVDPQGERALLSLLTLADPQAASWAGALKAWDDLGPRHGDTLRFWQKRSPLLAGYPPPFLQKVAEGLPEAIPVGPPGTEKKGPPLSVAWVYVLYSHPFAGSAHTQAAVLVAHHYALWWEEAFGSLGVLPAGSDDQKKALEKLPPSWQKAQAFALQKVLDTGGILFPPSWDEGLKKVWEAIKGKALKPDEGRDWMKELKSFWPSPSP